MRILITYGWCRTAYVVAESLSRAGFDVYVCDSSHLSMTRFSRYIQGFDRVADPFREPKEYVAQLSHLIRRRKIDILLPIHEDALIIQNYRYLLPEDLTIASPSREDLLTVTDKYKIIQIAEIAGVDVPKTVAPDDLKNLKEFACTLKFPLMIKTRRGNSGKGVFPVKDIDELLEKYREIVHLFQLDNPNLPILQEYVLGEVHGSCFLAERGQVKACFIERYLRCKEGGFGTSVLREPRYLPMLQEATCKMVERLQWDGIGHFDFIVPPDLSQGYLIEMNPRFWGALNLSIQNGYDFPRAWLSRIANKNYDMSSLQPTKKNVKSLWIVGELIAALSEFKKGNNLAFLLSIKRLISAGIYDRYDDFRWHDPLPLLIEMAYYGTTFLKSGGQINPVIIEMMR
jgi:predicted ATP-grasp superfamily ATP-dependent carboligase